MSERTHRRPQLLDPRFGDAVAAARICHGRERRRSTCARRWTRRWCWRRGETALVPTGLAIHIGDPGAVRA